MNFETQPKTVLTTFQFTQFLLISGFFIISGCSFVELHPGAHRIIYSNDLSSCKKIDTYTAKVQTETLLIERNKKAISEELQILAQNKALELDANSIWPTSEIENGEQAYNIMKCEYPD